MITVTYWNAQNSFECEVDYITPSDHVRAFIDMVDTLTKKGYVMLTIGNKSQLITSLDQLSPSGKW